MTYYVSLLTLTHPVKHCGDVSLKILQFIPHIITRFSTDNDAVVRHNQAHEAAAVKSLRWSHISDLSPYTVTHTYALLHDN